MKCHLSATQTEVSSVYLPMVLFRLMGPVADPSTHLPSPVSLGSLHQPQAGWELQSLQVYKSEHLVAEITVHRIKYRKNSKYWDIYV